MSTNAADAADSAAPQTAPQPEERVPYDEGEIFAIERPHGTLMRYYLIFSLLFLPLMPFVLLPLWLRYRTLRYRFDDEGIAVRWGALRRREVSLAYARIQDIHLTSNAIERWLGLARIQIQTASGSQSAEVTIEGIRAYEALRSFLVERMRSERGDRREGGPPPRPAGEPDAALEEVAASLHTVAEELRRLRLALARQAPSEEIDA